MTCFASLDLGDVVIFSCGLLTKAYSMCLPFLIISTFLILTTFGVGGAIFRRTSLAFLEIEKNTCLHIT